MPSKRSAKKAAPGAAGVDLSALQQDPQNARSHTSRNVEMIRESIAKVGPARPILIDEMGVILAGNATHQAALQQGLTKARVIEVDGKTLVAVRVKDLSDAEKAYLALADNRAAELATWNPARVQALIDKGHGDVVEAVWYPNELEKLLAMPALAPAEAGSDTYIPRRAGGAGAPAPALRFGTYRLTIPAEEAARLTTALQNYQRAHGSFVGLMAAAFAQFDAQHGGDDGGAEND